MDNPFTVTFIHLMSSRTLCFFFPQWWPQLCCWASDPGAACREEEEEETPWQPAYLPLLKTSARERRQKQNTSINKCDHVQCGGPPHLSWIQGAQAYRLLHHLHTCPHILVPPGSLIITAILQQTAWNLGKCAQPQDSEWLWTRSLWKQRWKQAATRVPLSS